MAERNGVTPFEILFQTNPVALAILNAQGTVVAANAAARKLLHEPFGEGANVKDFLSADDGLRVVAALEQLAENNAPSAISTHVRGENAGAITWQVWRAPAQSEIFATLSRDHAAEVTATKETTPAEKCTEKGIDDRVLRAMLENLDVLVWAVDKDGIYNFFDGKATAAIGAKPGALLGANVFHVFKDQISPAMRGALEGTATHESISISGAHWENWYVSLKDDQGAYDGVIGISQNMNESQRIREELETRLALIERQQAVIRDLETPIIQVWDKVLTLPMIGIVDSKRAARVMEDLLQSVVRSAARFAILDLTGVELVDTATASYLLQMVHAIRLLGAEGILTGIRPSVAQTVISLGVDLKGIPVHGTLRHGLAYCIRELGGGK